MESIISNVDSQVDRCFGREEHNAQYRLGKKYELIFMIANNIPVEFKQMSAHIQLKAGIELDKIHTAKSIQDFMTAMTTDFENKGMLRDYTRGMIPASKKRNVNANNTTVKPNDDIKNDAKWHKMKLTPLADNNHKSKMRTIIDEKAKDPKNNDTEIWKDQYIIDLCKKEKAWA